MSDSDSRVRQLQTHMAQCLRTVEQISGELQALRSRLQPVGDDVQRVIGGTAQGTDAQMVSSLTAATHGLEKALDSCAHASAMAQRLRSAL